MDVNMHGETWHTDSFWPRIQLSFFFVPMVKTAQEHEDTCAFGGAETIRSSLINKLRDLSVATNKRTSTKLMSRLNQGQAWTLQFPQATVHCQPSFVGYVLLAMHTQDILKQRKLSFGLQSLFLLVVGLITSTQMWWRSFFQLSSKLKTRLEMPKEVSVWGRTQLRFL